MHAFDHLIPEALGATVERRNQTASAIQFCSSRCECLVAGADLVRVDKALAVEAECPALSRFGEETGRVIELIVNSIEYGNVRCASGKYDRLERGGNRGTNCIERQPKIGA